MKSEIGGIAATSSYVGILVRRQLEFFYLNSYDKPIGPAALHPKDRQTFASSIHGQTDSHSLVSFCLVSLYVCSYVR